MADSFDVRIWAIEARARSARVRWVVDGQQFGESFMTVTLADAFRSQLVTATRRGEAFDTETGLPRSLLRKRLDVSFLGHAREFAAREWKTAAATSRASMLDMLIRAVPAVTSNTPGRP